MISKNYAGAIHLGNQNSGSFNNVTIFNISVGN